MRWRKREREREREIVRECVNEIEKERERKKILFSSKAFMKSKKEKNENVKTN